MEENERKNSGGKAAIFFLPDTKISFPQRLLTDSGSWDCAKQNRTEKKLEELKTKDVNEIF